jgi:hypothetical protein
MEGDSNLEDYNLAESNDGILPRTGAEERRIVGFLDGSNIL